MRKNYVPGYGISCVLKSSDVNTLLKKKYDEDSE